MSVDKFGRHESFVAREVLRGPPGEGFLLTEEGHYDLKRKRICNVADPVYNEEAVNLKTVLRITLNCDNDHGTFDARNKLIQNVALPVHNTDAVNYAFLSQELNKLKQDIYDKIDKLSLKVSTIIRSNSNGNYYSYNVAHAPNHALPFPLSNEEPRVELL